MTKLPQVSHERIVRALKRAGFYVLREGKHISMTDNKHLVIIPRHHTIKPGTLKQSWTPPKLIPTTSRIFSEELAPLAFLLTPHGPSAATNWPTATTVA
jgi:predicted RNA binding protein YcfA (HicA-like mRNA interferase family)